MAQVASTDPAVAENAIGDNEEDESKVRGIRPHSLLVTTALLSHTTKPPPGNSPHETARRRNGTRG